MKIVLFGGGTGLSNILSGKKNHLFKNSTRKPKVPKELIKIIIPADILIFYLGSLYASILPNLLIKKIKIDVLIINNGELTTEQKKNES